MDHIERVRQELKGIDSLLDVIEHPAIHRFALIAWWPENEPKRALVKSGEVDPNSAYDILGWFSQDPWDAETEPLDVVLDKRVTDILNKCDNRREDWKQRLTRIAQKNIDVRRRNRESLSQQAEDVAKDLWYMAGHNEEVTMKRIMNDIKEEALCQKDH
jgi:hypothetical protein